MPHRQIVAAVTMSSLAAFTVQAQAAEIKVFCSNGLRAVVQEIVPGFERESHHKVSLDFGPAAVLSQRIQAGEAFDLAILTPEAVDALVASGRAAAASRTTIALSRSRTSPPSPASLGRCVRPARSPGPRKARARSRSKPSSNGSGSPRRSRASSSPDRLGPRSARPWPQALSNMASSPSVRFCRSPALPWPACFRPRCKASSSWWPSLRPRLETLGPRPISCVFWPHRPTTRS
jgi:hypothetical protein